MSREDGVRDWGDHKSRDIRVAGNLQKLRGVHEQIYPLGPQEEPSRADTFISDFRPPELWEDKFLLF